MPEPSSRQPRPRHWWLRIRKTDVLFVVGLAMVLAEFAKWWIDETPPDPYLLGVSVWFTTGVAILPRGLEAIRRYGGEP